MAESAKTDEQLIYEEYERRIKEILEANAPSKVGNVPNLMAKNKGKEYNLYMKVARKYREPVLGRYKPPKREEEELEEEIQAASSDEEGEESDEMSSDGGEDAGPITYAWTLIMRQKWSQEFKKDSLNEKSEESFANCEEEVMQKFRHPKLDFTFRLRFPQLHDDINDSIATDDDGNHMKDIIWRQKSSPLTESVKDYEQIVNPYGEAFDGLCVEDEDDRSSMFISPSGGLRVGNYEGGDSKLCGPLDLDWGEPMNVSVVELYVAVPPVLAMPFSENERDAGKKHHGELQGTAEIKSNCLYLPGKSKETPPFGGVEISYHEDFRFQSTDFTWSLFVQKHFMQKQGAGLITKGERGFELKIFEAMQGDMICATIRSGSNFKIKGLFRPKSEFDLPTEKGVDARDWEEDPNLKWVHVALTYGDETLRLYVNGEEVVSRKHRMDSLGYDKHDILVGSDGNDGTLIGRICELYMYRVCLSADEIKTLIEETQPRLAQINEGIKQEMGEAEEEARKKAAPNKQQMDAAERIRRKMARRKAKRRKE